MAKVKRYKGDGESLTSAWSNKGDKRYGFVSKDRIPDERLPESRWTTRYGVGIDNLPIKNDSSHELNTLLGTLDFGSEDGTAYAGFTPNFERTSDYYTNGEGNPWSMDYARTRLGEALLQAGKSGDPSNPQYFAGAFLPGDEQYIPDINKSIRTPLGKMGFETNYENPNYLEATYEPAHYIQALVNLLRGR